MTEYLSYINTSNLFTDTIAIIESAKRTAYRSVNVVLVQRNWLLGKRIAEEQLGDQTREELYGRILLLILLNNSLRSMGVVSIAVVCINMYASINAFQTLWTRRVHNLFY